ncbi:MAG: DUF1616 domain-containing protein [Candidatus Methanomethylicus sp.]|nr:DUF1616 domain-containing protein [Candidatus Methanomethylicus sp.]
MDDELRLVVMGIILAAGVLAISQTTVGQFQFEPFSTISILGSNMTLDNYPQNVTVNQTNRLYIYLDNQEGHLSYYEVRMKLGNSSTATGPDSPSQAEQIGTISAIVPSGNHTLIPVDFRIDATATNAKLIFELWVIDSNGPHYSGKWNQLWINAT